MASGKSTFNFEFLANTDDSPKVLIQGAIYPDDIKNNEVELDFALSLKYDFSLDNDTK